ncbi:hypothetical protein CRG98_041340 [Punica granatum]|uniref:Uncharacterized protein n=1 Tax=Punica granatum TaxID=22663 RepID=A0A2I0I376_PUNGR|nr:hypothetical protein CRG98_041340 [Punica granatum]
MGWQAHVNFVGPYIEFGANRRSPRAQQHADPEPEEGGKKEEEEDQRAGTGSLPTEVLEIAKSYLDQNQISPFRRTKYWLRRDFG